MLNCDDREREIDKKSDIHMLVHRLHFVLDDGVCFVIFAYDTKEKNIKTLMLTNSAIQKNISAFLHSYIKDN
jgi:hypothetical protein